MKPILLAIAFTTFSLSNLMLPHKSLSDSLNEHLYFDQNQSYLNQKLDLSSTIVDGFGCIDCHGSMDMAPSEITEMLKEITSNYNSALIVHQEEDPNFIEGLETFIETNDKDQAWEKYIDIVKIESILADQ